MRRTIGLWLCAAMAASSSLAASHPQRTVVDRVVAVVNDETILLSEWEEAWTELSRTLPPADLSDPEKAADYRQRILENLIRDKLVSQEADRQKIAVKDEQVDFRLAELREKNFGGNAAQFAEALRMQGMTETEFKDRIRNQIKQQVLIGKEVTAKVAVSDQEVEEFYSKHALEFSDPEMRRVRHILVALPPRAKRPEVERAQTRAAEIVRRLSQGESFPELARQHSSDKVTKERGGDLGMVSKGELVASLEKAVFSLPVGQTSEVIRTDQGLEILQVSEIQAQATRALDEKVAHADGEVTVRELVKQRVQDERFRDTFEAWVARLRNESTVILKD